MAVAAATTAATRVAGFATAEATAAFKDRFVASSGLALKASAYGVLPSGVSVSCIGVGTYQGDLGQEHDDLVVDAIVAGVQGGVNVIDTAVNYRLQQGERCVGRALRRLFAAGAADGELAVSRDEVFVSTKAGFVPGDYCFSTDKEEGMRKTAQELVESGVPPEEICGDGFRHSLHPRALDILLEKSLDNLGLESVDLFYLHNAENQIGMGVSREVLMDRVRKAFVWCESKIAAGKIKSYGLATWDCFRVPPEDPAYFGLSDMSSYASAAAVEIHGAGATAGFAAVQVPINVGKVEALVSTTQPGLAPMVEQARDAGLAIFASSSLGGGCAPPQARICEEHASMASLLAGGVRWLQFTRSCPNVVCALVGMKRPGNVASNLSLLREDRLGENAFGDLLASLVASADAPLSG
eukprot:TRINITY_DN55649_c0_g1_i1.p1 TRINITY_DN55649_c0_g1~~TRINITY_DN55649_c0_g1_i1.p1  ORF type:complete len:411 (-),score=70.59 TRINITY_DN55649_c0_g1_i1:77-1309(-)